MKASEHLTQATPEQYGLGQAWLAFVAYSYEEAP
jgi:hypothetical protein